MTKDLATLILVIVVYHLGRFCCYPTEFDHQVVEGFIRSLL